MKILAAVDLREEDPEALVDAAGAWAKRMQARVDLLFVDEVGAVPPWITDPHVADLLTTEWDRVRTEEQARLGTLLARLDPARRGEAIRAHGRPADTILDLAKAYDLVLVRGRPHGPIERLLLGSVAARVARDAPTSVMVVRPPLKG